MYSVCTVHSLTTQAMPMQEMVSYLEIQVMILHLNQCGRENTKYLSGFLTLNSKH